MASNQHSAGPRPNERSGRTGSASSGFYEQRTEEHDSRASENCLGKRGFHEHQQYEYSSGNKEQRSMSKIDQLQEQINKLRKETDHRDKDQGEKAADSPYYIPCIVMPNFYEGSHWDSKKIERPSRVFNDKEKEAQQAWEAVDYLRRNKLYYRGCNDILDPNKEKEDEQERDFYKARICTVCKSPTHVEDHCPIKQYDPAKGGDTMRVGKSYRDFMDWRIGVAFKTWRVTRAKMEQVFFAAGQLKSNVPRTMKIYPESEWLVERFYEKFVNKQQKSHHENIFTKKSTAASISSEYIGPSSKKKNATIVRPSQIVPESDAEEIDSQKGDLDSEVASQESNGQEEANYRFHALNSAYPKITKEQLEYFEAYPFAKESILKPRAGCLKQAATLAASVLYNKSSENISTILEKAAKNPKLYIEKAQEAMKALMRKQGPSYVLGQKTILSQIANLFYVDENLTMASKLRKDLENHWKEESAKNSVQHSAETEGHSSQVKKKIHPKTALPYFFGENIEVKASEEEVYPLTLLEAEAEKANQDSIDSLMQRFESEYQKAKYDLRDKAIQKAAVKEAQLEKIESKVLIKEVKDLLSLNTTVFKTSEQVHKTYKTLTRWFQQPTPATMCIINVVILDIEKRLEQEGLQFDVEAFREIAENTIKAKWGCLAVSTTLSVYQEPYFAKPKAEKISSKAGSVRNPTVESAKSSVKSKAVSTRTGGNQQLTKGGLHLDISEFSHVNSQSTVKVSKQEQQAQSKAIGTLDVSIWTTDGEQAENQGGDAFLNQLSILDDSGIATFGKDCDLGLDDEDKDYE